MSDLLSPGEFSLTDKLAPREHIEGRLSALRKLYGVDPDLAREVISYAWPNANGRPWGQEELHGRLAIQEKEASLRNFFFFTLMKPFTNAAKAIHRHRTPTKDSEKRAAIDVTARFFKSASADVVNSVFPSLGAAFDAFSQERQRQDAIAQMENFQKYPALNFTQPSMAMYAMGAEPPHHRHRHHVG